MRSPVPPGHTSFSWAGCLDADINYSSTCGHTEFSWTSKEHEEFSCLLWPSQPAAERFKVIVEDSAFADLSLFTVNVIVLRTSTI